MKLKFTLVPMLFCGGTNAGQINSIDTTVPKIGVSYPPEDYNKTESLKEPIPYYIPYDIPDDIPYGPETNSINDCIDSELEYYISDKVRQDCKWVKKDTKRCKKYKKLPAKYCPLTCEKCKKYQNKDAPGTFQRKKKNKKLKCKKVEKKKKFCDEEGVASVCRKTCKTTPPTPTWKSGNTYPAWGGQTSALYPQGSSIYEGMICGSTQAVLAHPSDNNICFAGASNGGVWRTMTCAASQPNWLPLTDNEESLSVGDMVFNADYSTTPASTDPNKIIVAIGSRSSFYRIGGPGIGMLLTSNALDPTPTWTTLTNNGYFRANDVKFNSVYMHDDFILASAYMSNPFSCSSIGVWRSIDGGVSWLNVLEGKGRAVAADPNDPNRFYATVDLTNVCNLGKGYPDSGVFTSNNGVDWTHTSHQAPGPLNSDELNNAKLSVSADGSRVWSALLKNGQAYSIAYSDNLGNSWTKLDDVKTKQDDGSIDGLNPREKPGSQGSIHFALLASPTNKDEIYVAGDRQDGPFPNAIGAQDYTGRLFRGDATKEATGLPWSPQWVHMTNSNQVTESPGGGTLSSSGPHADGRDMEIRADGSILESDDGGITIRTSPSDNTGDWFSVCGDMQAFESHNVAYDPVLNRVLFGNQDTGTIAGELGTPYTFQSLATADGGDCMIDFSSDESSNYYYFSTQAAAYLIQNEFNKQSGDYSGYKIVFLPERASFVPVVTMNPSNQAEFVVAMASGSIAHTKNRGDTLEKFSLDSLGVTDVITAMDWSTDGSYLYMGSQSSKIISCQVPISILNCERFSDVPSSFTLQYMAVDPTNPFNVVLTTGNDYGSNFEVWSSQDGGSTWSDITTEGSSVDLTYNGFAITWIYEDIGSSFIVVGTSHGVYLHNESSNWVLLAENLPNVRVYDMIYDKTDDLLIVSTLGRGIWYLENAYQSALDTWKS